MKTLLGDALYERAYYHCPHCHTGIFPTDEQFGIDDKKTPGATEVMALMGVLEPFEEGAGEVLPRLSGLNVSASSVQRTTETVGSDVAECRAAGETFGPAVPWKWHTDARGRSTAYVSLDATGVPQQGPHGEQAEGRMPWVGTVFNPESPGQKRHQRIWDSRCVAGLMSLSEMSAQLGRECRAVGVDRADQVIALTDGGPGLQECLLDAVSGLAREVVFILDFWHVSDHLQEFAKLFIADEVARCEQVKAWCHELKHAGGAALLESLQGLDFSRASPSVREAHRQLTGYLGRNLHRTDYPKYVQNGWQIGSGKVESACQSVVGRRLKGPGMRWREFGTTAVCQLRALYKSNLWQAYWKRTTPI